MKKDIKHEILMTALDLFGKEGYNNVSMRNIADAIGISVGNLTYHFKRKEELIEAVILEQHEKYQVPSVPQTLEELNQYFAHIVDHHKKNEYYFRHYTQLAQISPKVYAIQVKVMRKNYKILSQAFDILKSQGILKEEEIEGQYQDMIHALLMVKIYWSPLQNDLAKGTDKVTNPLSCIWSILFPCLTRAGKEQYQNNILKK